MPKIEAIVAFLERADEQEAIEAVRNRIRHDSDTCAAAVKLEALLMVATLAEIAQRDEGPAGKFALRTLAALRSDRHVENLRALAPELLDAIEGARIGCTRGDHETA